MKALKIPFHRWYQWLGTRFSQFQQIHQREVELKKEEAKKWQEEQEQKREKNAEESKPSGMGMGIFDKIYKYMNKESKDEREERERKELEKERTLLLGSNK